MTALGQILLWQEWPGQLSVQAMTAVSIATWIPSNMFAVVVLGYVQEIFAALNIADSESIIADAKRLQAEIQEGIENYAYTTNSKGEKNLCLRSRRFRKC